MIYRVILRPRGGRGGGGGRAGGAGAALLRNVFFGVILTTWRRGDFGGVLGGILTTFGGVILTTFRGGLLGENIGLYVGKSLIFRENRVFWAVRQPVL